MDNDYYYYYFDDCNLINYINQGGMKKWKRNYLIFLKKEDM